MSFFIPRSNDGLSIEAAGNLSTQVSGTLFVILVYLNNAEVWMVFDGYRSEPTNYNWYPVIFTFHISFSSLARSKYFSLIPLFIFFDFHFRLPGR